MGIHTSKASVQLRNEYVTNVTSQIILPRNAEVHRKTTTNEKVVEYTHWMKTEITQKMSENLKRNLAVELKVTGP